MYLFCALLTLRCADGAALEPRILDHQIAVSSHEWRLPSGLVRFENMVLVPIALEFSGGTRVIGYAQASGNASASLDFRDPAQGRVAQYNLEGVELGKRSSLNALEDQGRISSLTLKGSGLWFTSLTLEGEKQELSAEARKRAEAQLERHRSNRETLHLPTELCLQPELAALSAVVDGRPYLAWLQLIDGPANLYFLDGLRTMNMGIVVFNERDGISRPQAQFLAGALPDPRQANFANLGVTQLSGTISSADNRVLNFDLTVDYLDPLGGSQLLYLHLLGSRSAKRLKNSDSDRYQLNFGSISETDSGARPAEDPFGRADQLDLLEQRRHQEGKLNLVRSVRNSKGEELPFHQLGDGLVVDLTRKTTQGESFRLSFAYGGQLLAQDLGMEIVHWDGLAWFPRGNEAHARPSLDLEITVQEPWLAIGPGSCERKEEGKSRILKLKETHPVSHANFIVGKFHENSHISGDTTIQYYSYAQNRKQAVAKMQGLASQFLNFYSQLLGGLPYRSFAVVELKEFMLPRQQTSGLLTFPTEAFERFSANRRSATQASTNSSLGANETLAVGLAKLWWGGCVQPGSHQEEWLNSAFPEYCGYLILKLSKKDDVEDRFVKRWQARAAYANTLPIALADQVVDHHHTSIDWDLKLSKAAMALKSLHERMGDQAFFNLLSGFIRASQFKTPTLQHLAIAAGSLTHQDERPSLEQSFWGFE
jgi:hypothetical protein